MGIREWPQLLDLKPPNSEFHANVHSVLISKKDGGSFGRVYFRIVDGAQP